MSNRTAIKLIDNLDSAVLEPLKQIQVQNNNIAGDVIYRQVTPNEAGSFGYQLTKIATFEISNQMNAWDFQNTTINGSIALATGTTGCLDECVKACFQRMRLLTSNNIVLEDIQFYNVLNVAEQVITANSSNCAQKWKEWADVLPLAEASKIQITASAQYFEIRIELNFAKLQKIAHLPVIGGLKVELTFDQDLNALSSSDSATPKLSITNLRMNCRLIPMTQDFIDQLRKQASIGQFLYNIENVYVENQSWANANNSFQVNFPMKSAHSFLARFYLSGDVNAQNKKYVGKSQYLPSFTSIQLQHGVNNIPTNPIDNPFTAHKYLQELFGMNDTDCGNYVVADSNDVACAYFYVGLDLTSGGMNTGVDLSNSCLVFPTINTSTANLYCQLWVYYSSVIQCFGVGDVRVYSV